MGWPAAADVVVSPELEREILLTASTFLPPPLREWLCQVSRFTSRAT